MSNKGKVVLDVTTANGRTRVKLDGKVVTARQGRAAGKVSTTPLLPAVPFAPYAHSLLAFLLVAGQRKRRGDQL